MTIRRGLDAFGLGDLESRADWRHTDAGGGRGGALARNLLRVTGSMPWTSIRGSTGNKSLLKTRSYRMSVLDIAMAGGVVLLVVLMVLRKKTR
jgi:hypothetical protein